ncbi:ankyrin repeat domain-containing protein, partial [bacterium]|nr:ankyrin repeat domain-containing protein [bacterium]
LNEVRQEGEEAIDGDQCYIIAGKMANMTMKYWISKDTLLVRQRQQILGGKLEFRELSKKNIKKALESAGGQVTDEAIRKFKDRIRLSQIMVSKMKGTITEIHRNIVINQPIDFKPYISKYADIEIAEPVIQIPELQIGQGADVNTKDEEGLTALHLAARQGRKDAVELLLANGANINARLIGWPGWTPLHEAATANHKEVAELLITKGADTNANCARAGGGRFGGTPLHEAVFEGHRDMAELLISKRADINAKQSGGLTPLDVAAFVGHKDVVELLIARGADVNIRDRGGRTALRWAKHGRHKEIVELLQKHGAEE